MKIKTTTYPSGQTKIIEQYLNNKRNGQWIFFFENGLVKWIGNYYKDKQQGLWMEWYEDGHKKEESHYIDDKKIPINFWDESRAITLKDGNGYTIVEFGASSGDVYYQYYKSGVFIKEEKIKGVTYGGFLEDQK